jgi:hypothetical protein
MNTHFDLRQSHVKHGFSKRDENGEILKGNGGIDVV